MLLGSLQNGPHPPPLVPAQWPRFNNENLISYTTLIAFIVGLVFRILSYIFMENSVFDQALRTNNYGFFHFAADHHTLDRSLVPPAFHDY
jgi:hypothetical protein